MAIVINGDGSISGISAGGLPTGSVTADTLATNSVDSAELIDGAVDDSHMAAMAATKLTGTIADARLGGDKVCKTWVSFNGTGTVAIIDSHNVSSVTDSGTGDYLVYHDTDMANANYCIFGSAPKGPYAGSSSNSTICQPGELRATTHFSIYLVDSTGGTTVDRASVYGASFGDQ